MFSGTCHLLPVQGGLVPISQIPKTEISQPLKGGCSRLRWSSLLVDHISLTSWNCSGNSLISLPAHYQERGFATFSSLQSAKISLRLSPLPASTSPPPSASPCRTHSGLSPVILMVLCSPDTSLKAFLKAKVWIRDNESGTPH